MLCSVYIIIRQYEYKYIIYISNVTAMTCGVVTTRFCATQNLTAAPGVIMYITRDKNPIISLLVYSGCIYIYNSYSCNCKYSIIIGVGV